MATISGASFKKASFSRPTAMSLALEKAGLIPAQALCLVREMAAVAVVKHRNDNKNIRPSLRVVL